MKRYYYFLLFITSMVVVSCAEKDSPAPISPVKDVWMHDLANNEKSSDLQVLFVLSEDNSSQEFRIVLSKASPSTSITNEHLQSLSANAYTTVSVNSDLTYRIRLKEGQLDSDGDPVAHDVSYIAYVFSAELGTFSNSENALLFSNNKIHAGKYSGEWQDNLFSNVQISCVIQGGANEQYRGPVYISGDYTPSFGATDNNGDFKISIQEGVIVEFEYRQHAPEYMGGCPGVYKGTGIVDDNFNLIINFTGDDCDGHHEDGIMSLYRDWKD